jgi:hypothetical protein
VRIALVVAIAACSTSEPDDTLAQIRARELTWGADKQARTRTQRIPPG